MRCGVRTPDALVGAAACGGKEKSAEEGPLAGGLWPRNYPAASARAPCFAPALGAS